MKEYKYISFDYFMTLVELEKPFKKIEQWIRRTYSDTEQGYQIIFKKFMREYARLYATRKYILGKRLLADALERVTVKYALVNKLGEFELFLFQLFTDTKAYKDSKWTIEKLKTKYKVGLLTNADNDILWESIQKQGFQFDFVISSEDVGCNKPDAEIFEYACQLLKCKKQEIIHIGDSQVDDIFAGGRAGIHTIWINRNLEELKEEIIPPITTLSDLKDLIGELM